MSRQPLVAATGLFALGACYLALYLLGDWRLYVVEFVALALLAGILYFVSLYLMSRLPAAPATLYVILGGALLFRGLLLPLTPALSDDLHRYRWDARLQHAGFNPYAVRPDDPRVASLRETDWDQLPGRDIATIYPPLAELAFRAALAVSTSPLALKLPALLGDLLLVGLLARWIQQTSGPVHLVALYAWNPLVVVETAASGHFDPLASAALLGACMVIISGRQTLSTLLLAAAALLKLYPVVLFPLWLRRAGWPRSRWSWLNLLAALLFALLCFWPYREGGEQWLANLADFEARWLLNNASLFAALLEWSGSRELAAGVAAGSVAGLGLWLAARRADAARAAYVLIGAMLLLSPNAFSWYFTWLIPLLVFFPNPAWLLLSVTQFLSYHVLIGFQASGTWRFEPFYLGLTYGPSLAWLIWQVMRRPAPGPGYSSASASG